MYDMTNCRHGYAVYSMTNNADENEIIAIRQKSNDDFTFIKAYRTGGQGTGNPIVDPLSSQGSIVISDDGHFLFAVNAGSNNISSFKITKSGTLILADVSPSGGFLPISLTTHRNLLYVANAGNGSSIASNVTGFHIDKNGMLTEIIGSAKPLSSVNAKPTCIVINYNGKKIAVSEQNTNLISVFTVQQDGSLNGPIVSNSSGPGPFGSVFLTNEILLVTEVGINALSSYKINHDGTLSVISPSVLNFQSATCWVSLSENGRFAYTSNAGGHTITTYEVERNGRLDVSNIIYSTNDGSGSPIDSGICSNNLYVLNGNEGSISVFFTDRNGRLIRTEVIRDTQLPIIGSQGLAILCLPNRY
ncbi:lactonase family protein [Lacrimispora celerecrescens]|uniref:lactonase family protein n=1 Tax=Lacrimispora celerecrescens TaxID=29354 RepID=UPI001649623E|nr:beta-propeller fold lactonase family protein [Lacrimispora celerecrescens]